MKAVDVILEDMVERAEERDWWPQAESVCTGALKTSLGKRANFIACLSTTRVANGSELHSAGSTRRQRRL